MERIASFCVDHNVLEKGLYISRIDGDIVTYDMRLIKPNCPPYLDSDGVHTFEHLFATFARNSKFADNIIYCGPMGCRTGFYFLVRNMQHSDVITLLQDVMAKINAFEGVIPGVSAIECGNYLEHSLEKCKKYSSDYAKVLEGYTVEKMYY